MAEAVASVVVESLMESVIKELDASVQMEEVDDNLRSTERELAELRDVIEYFEAQPDNELDDEIKKWSVEAKKLESEAAHLTETYAKKIKQMQRLRGLPVVRLVKYRRLAKELLRKRLEILWTWRKGKELLKIEWDVIWIKEKGKEVGVSHKQQETDTFKNSIYAFASSAVRNLEVALGTQLYSVPRELYLEVSNTRSDLLPLFEILKLVVYENVEDLIDERRRVWIHMVEDIFKSINEESISFQKLLLVEKVGNLYETDFCEFILRKKKKLFILWGRWHTYGVGPFNGDVPHIDPGTIGSKLFLPAETKWKDSQLSRFESFIEGFTIDMELMNALWKDAKGMEVDERGKIWLKNMKKLHRELEAIFKYRYVRCYGNRSTKAKFYRRLARSAQLCEEFIYFLTMMKRYYCIDSFVPRDGSRSKHTEDEESVPLPSNLLKRDCVELVQIELQLMEALFHDVETISQQDERLKVWIQEMRYVANHSKPIIQDILNGSFTSKVAATKIDLICERISHISEWSITYGIGSIRAGIGSLSLTLELEEVGPYPTDPVAEQVDLIRREVRMMQALDTDAQTLQGMNSGTLEAWLEEMREVAGEAEILISRYSKKGQKASAPNKLPTSLCPVSPHIKSQREVLENIEVVKSKIQRLHQRRREYGIKYFDRKLSYTAEELRAKVFADKSEPFRIIPILGAWDNDKAFLKKFIEEEDNIMRHFALRMWLSAGEANEITMLENIARVMEQKDSNGSLIVSQPEEILKDKVKRKQNPSLIVLDEIQNSFSILNFVRELLIRTSRGSRIILVTSQIDVDLSGLNPSEMLSSVTMRVLPPQRKRSLLEMVPVKQSPTMPKTSAEAIPSYLRVCLYYFLLFSPENSKKSENYIPVRRLINLWVAEGFVRRKRGEDDVPLELIAERYLSELINLGMVEVKEIGRKYKRCRLKDDEREACLSKAKEDQFLLEKTNPGQGKYFGVEIGTSNILRLTDHPGDVNNSCHYHIHDPDNYPASLTSHYREVRSFLSFDTQERSKPGEDIGIFLDKGISKKCFLSLRILDLEHIFRPALPKELAKLIRLRYLGLRWTYLEALPPSVSELLNLQVLDVKHTYISKLPKSIWLMQYLRHLYLSEAYRTRFDGKPQRSLSLKNLQTLWGAFVDEDSPVEGGLDTLLNVRKLGLLCRSMYDKKKMATQLEAVANWVVRLKDIESLRLKSQDEKGMPSDLYLKPLSAHGNLSVLHIAGILKYPSVISDLPLNLTEVTLSGCELENDPLHSMEFLPRLIILRLLGDSSKCSKMRCSSRGFPKLEVLKLWKLEMLVELEVEEGGMPLLQVFEIRWCPNLEKLPDRLEHVCKRTYTVSGGLLTSKGNSVAQQRRTFEVWRGDPQECYAV